MNQLCELIDIDHSNKVRPWPLRHDVQSFTARIEVFLCEKESEDGWYHEDFVPNDVKIHVIWNGVFFVYSKSNDGIYKLNKLKRGRKKTDEFT
ncbi:hypothetical protein U473_08500 [Tepidibacillus decaturensis]|uniref:Uncharacterized protein n=1 Tax=Tepidibacillus decaturensis TaxID=1413211 RepID=A0A135L4W8_9BACI|nr:hypothetical protein U473_08500 [Tepidibacillus decaturensis]